MPKRDADRTRKRVCVEANCWNQVTRVDAKTEKRLRDSDIAMLLVAHGSAFFEIHIVKNDPGMKEDTVIGLLKGCR